MTAILQPDLCVVGASEAGRAVASGAVAMGFSVVVVDDGDPSGCDSRDLTLELLRVAADRSSTEPAAGWAEMRGLLQRAAAERSHARLAAMTMQVIAATGRFRDPETVEAGDTIVRARRFVIATGRATLRRPEADIFERLQTILRLPSRPDGVHLSGGDPEAIATALSLARLGAVATVGADELLPDFDPELVAPVLSRMRREGVTLVGSDDLPSDGTPRFAETTRPALDALAPQHAAIDCRDGQLTLTAGLRTTNPRVFAVGCPAGAQSTASGLLQAAVVLRGALLRLPSRTRPPPVPAVMLADPELAQVGLTEAAARERGAVQVWRWPLGHTGPGLATDGVPGHVKVVTDRRCRLLGAGIVGPQAREQIGIWTLALARRLTLADLADLPVASPSWSEAVRGIALSCAARRLASPWTRRALSVARKLV